MYLVQKRAGKRIILCSEGLLYAQTESERKELGTVVRDCCLYRERGAESERKELGTVVRDCCLYRERGRVRA